jgi:predicted nucleotidyltransferase
MSVLIKYKYQDPFRGRDRSEFFVEMLDRLGTRVESAYVFGSVARGAKQPQDIDLIFIEKTGLPFVERPRAFSDILEMSTEMDLLVYTQEEFGRLIESDSAFWRSVRRDLVALESLA